MNQASNPTWDDHICKFEQRDTAGFYIKPSKENGDRLWNKLSCKCIKGTNLPYKQEKLSWNLWKENGIKFMIKWKELWESDIGFTIGWDMTWDIQSNAKMVKEFKCPN